MTKPLSDQAMDQIPRDHLQRCFVLHRRDFANTSLILEVFSAAYGRQAILAKGAKRPRRRGHPGSGELLQPFRPLLLCWSGRGEVKTLVRGEPAGLAVELTGRVLYCGLYLNELLMRLLQRGDSHDTLFAFYHRALTDLAAGEHLETVLRHFELQLLHEIGYSVILDREAGSGLPINPDRYYVYEHETGLRRAVTADGEVAVSGRTLLDLYAGSRLTGQEAREAKALARRLLAPYLGQRPLKTRELFSR